MAVVAAVGMWMEAMVAAVAAVVARLQRVQQDQIQAAAALADLPAIARAVLSAVKVRPAEVQPLVVWLNMVAAVVAARTRPAHLLSREVPPCMVRVAAALAAVLALATLVQAVEPEERLDNIHQAAAVLEVMEKLELLVMVRAPARLIKLAKVVAVVVPLRLPTALLVAAAGFPAVAAVVAVVERQQAETEVPGDMVGLLCWRTNFSTNEELASTFVSFRNGGERGVQPMVY